MGIFRKSDNKDFANIGFHKAKNLDELREWVISSANPNVSDRTGGTALMAAAAYGDSNLARTLLQRGSSVNAQDNDGITALMIAARYGRIEIMQILIDHGANINLRQSQGGTALLIALTRNQLDAVEFLTEHGAE